MTGPQPLDLPTPLHRPARRPARCRPQPRRPPPTPDRSPPRHQRQPPPLDSPPPTTAKPPPLDSPPSPHADHRRPAAPGHPPPPPRPRASPHPRAAPASTGPAPRPAWPHPPGDRTPATCAAAISPIECPTSTSGATPHDRSKAQQRHLNREQRRLRIPGPMNQPLIGQDIRQRPIQMRLHMQRHLIKRIREHRERRIQTPAHPHPLRPLTGEQERHPTGSRPPHAPHRPQPRPRQDHRSTPRRRPRAPPPDAPEQPAAPRRHPAPPAEQCPHRDSRAAAPPAPAAPPRSPPTTAPARSATGAGVSTGSAAGASSRMTCAFVPLIPNDGHARPARPAAGRPRLRLGQQSTPRRRPSRRAATARPRAGWRAAGSCRSARTILIMPADAGRGLGVADVRLHRAEPQRPSRRSWP